MKDDTAADKVWDNPVLLEQWTNEELDALDAEADWWSQEVENHLLRSFQASYVPSRRSARKTSMAAWAITRARAGDLAPLRKLYPHLAEFLHEPPLMRGQHRSKVYDPAEYVVEEDLLQANADVQRIRKLWRERLGKTYRSTDPTALDIAARRHGLNKQQLENYRKGRHRQR